MKCPDCGSEEVAAKSTGETVCESCGAVLEERALDYGAEWVAFTPEEKERKMRTGAPLGPGALTSSLMTDINRRDASSLSPKQRAHAFLLRKLQKTNAMSPSFDRAVYFGSKQIDRACAALKIPDSVRKEAHIIYIDVISRGLHHGRSLAEVASASLFLAVRKANLPLSFDQLLEKKGTARTYRLLVTKMGLRLPIPDPLAFLSKLAANLGLEKSVEKKAEEILKRAKEVGISSGRDPAGVAAAAVYIACGGKLPQKDVAKAANVTEVTVRNRYREICDALKLPRPAVCERRNGKR
ncbi:hypothetical protein B9Q02_11815 [Candidatus Marsarchaeota G1 archaeon BE_D]|jgi:Transcription initiation factor TFIIIB, Brf1 subunit/Transcription initiation factor TFIIB|uniref:Transcription initiation factor IIB n=1 Tax=Candidatus Marsarchaeota G1 archaeon BE_D TaxID=1978156 RepID=A0A2R6A7P4_9ARCH|nr:MAG: hypothetical protein B9Q02_11815 [Candidatus Marsarchaeota G1 archaeon BE_D]